MKRLTIMKSEEIREKISKYFQESEDMKFAYKLQGILLLLNNKDTNCTEVSRIYGCTPQTLANWVHKLNQGKGGNIEVLRNKVKPGRSAHLSKNQLHIIKGALKKSPTHFNLKSTKWDGETLSMFLSRQFGVELKVRQCQRILRRMGYANKRGRPWDKLPE
jgi:transposase